MPNRPPEAVLHMLLRFSLLTVPSLYMIELNSHDWTSSKNLPVKGSLLDIV